MICMLQALKKLHEKLIPQFESSEEPSEDMIKVTICLPGGDRIHNYFKLTQPTQVANLL